MESLEVGLIRTGTKSLTRALEIRGFTAIHNDRERLNPISLGVDNTPDFRVYDDVDAVTDLPSAYLFRELLTRLSYDKSNFNRTKRTPGYAVIVTTLALKSFDGYQAFACALVMP